MKLYFSETDWLHILTALRTTQRTMAEPGQNLSAWDSERVQKLVAGIMNMLKRPPVEPITGVPIPWERALAFMPDLADGVGCGLEKDELAAQVQDLSLRLESLTNRYAERFSALEAAVYTPQPA